MKDQERKRKNDAKKIE